ncbi:MAG: glycosyltransferase family 2 protein [Pirellulaceae bacterium]
MELSIVATLYCSAQTVEEFCRRAVLAAEQVAGEFEIVLVDDGSPDDSLEIACRLAEADPRITVVELSRNFGHHKAMMTGLEHAEGDLVFLIDSDLEEAPELLPEFYGEMQQRDVDVVYGYQRARKGNLFERATGAVSYCLINRLIQHPIPRNHLTVRLMTRDYVRSLLLHRETQTIIGGLWVITGYRQHGVPVTKLHTSPTTYSLRRRCTALIDSVTNFSEMPLIVIFYVGFAISVFSALVGMMLVVWKLAGGTVDGWASVMMSVWFLGGLILFSVGTIGLYVSKIFLETKNRPYTIVRRVYPAERDAASHRRPIRRAA